MTDDPRLLVLRDALIEGRDRDALSLIKEIAADAARPSTLRAVAVEIDAMMAAPFGGAFGDPPREVRISVGVLRSWRDRIREVVIDRAPPGLAQRLAAREMRRVQDHSVTDPFVQRGDQFVTAARDFEVGDMVVAAPSAEALIARGIAAPMREAHQPMGIPGDATSGYCWHCGGVPGRGHVCPLED